MFLTASSFPQVINLGAGVPSYMKYEVTVKANNAIGDATTTPEKVIGYSGEDSKSHRTASY